MQIVDNTYQVADGYFISNYIGEAAFDGENLIFPALLIVMYVGLMFGTGASALISKELGENRKEKANRILSMAILVLTFTGIVLSAVMYVLMPTITRWMGASEELSSYCVTYGRILSIFMTLQMLSMAFHPLLITAERPRLGLAVTIINAVVNILLDWIFVVGFHWGLRGAAVATGIAWLVSAVIPIIFFMDQKRPLHFTRPTFDLSALGRVLYNGVSEMVDGVSYAIVALIFNLRMMFFLGEEGIGAFAVSEYVGGLFSAVFYGISMSIVPVVGYHLGQQNKEELHSLRRNGLTLMGIFGILMTGLSMIFSNPIARVFVGYNEELTAVAARGMRLVSLSYLLGGITIYSSSYFTGLNQGSASLIIAAMKGFIGPLTGVYLLPLLIGATGLWLAQPFAEVLALIAALLCYLWWNKNEDQKIREATAADAV
jgi:putative MATE family efflux protein